jgi:AcrR family transcriptional regulator
MVLALTAGSPTIERPGVGKKRERSAQGLARNERSYYYLPVVMSKGEETRERILERAFRLASRDGLDGLSIGILAGELGLSKSGLFAHFGSKEELQVEVLRAAAQRFEAQVMRPAFRAARGEPRVRALFDNWLQWMQDASSPGGCLFLAASTELDDKEGRPRDYLVGMQRQLLASIARAARMAIEAGHFRPELDCEQFAFELYGLLLGHGHFRRLLRDPRAESRTRAAFDRLLRAARTAS